MGPSLPSSASLDRAALQHYVWKDVLRRGPGLPSGLLVELAQNTAPEVPPYLEPLAALEWHIEHVLRLARERVNFERRQRGEFPVLYHVATDTIVTHLYRELIPGSEHAGDEQACETTLPNAVCSCGRYLIELVAPHPNT